MSWVFDGTLDSIDRLRTIAVPDAHRQLEAALGNASDRSGSEPSRLPGWTLGHLVAHLRLNAESHLRVLTNAQHGRLVEQYQGGAAGRANAIERHSTQPLDELIDALHHTNTDLEALWASLDLAAWHQPTSMRAGQRPAHVSLWARWRETCLHTTDLGLGHTSEDWTTEFAIAGLDINIDGLELRSLQDRLGDHCVVELTAGTQTWTSDQHRAPTHTATGSPQALLGWIVQRPAATPPSWHPEPPALDPWP